MSAPANRLATGILPDSVIRTPNANATLLSVTLSEQLTNGAVKAWLTDVTGLIDTLQSTVEDGHRVATVNVAFSATFFQTAPGTARFELTADQIPVELAAPPVLSALANVPVFPGDVLFYVFCTSEAALATFKEGLSATHPAAVVAVTVEEGFQRHDGRERFGFRDGLRNIPTAERPQVVFLDPERSPEEPAWTAGGSYLAYLKIRQDVTAIEQKSDAEQEQLIGRRKTDGSRLDLPLGTIPTQEGEFTGTDCPMTAHVRKVGPRGALHDGTRIFRRGVPYTTLNLDGSDETGLQFVSYQRSLDEFATIFGRWMTNPSFPAPGTGTDSLLASGVITIEKFGFFFSPPKDARFIGASIFDPPPVDPCATGRIVVQKELLDQNGQPVLSELGGVAFQIRQAGQPVGPEFTTDSTGRAVSQPVPRATALTVHEVTPPPGFEQAADTEITLQKARTLVRVVNHQAPNGEPHYTG